MISEICGMVKGGLKMKKTPDSEDLVCCKYEEHDDKIRMARKNMPDEEIVLDISNFFDALGNPTRVKILLAIMDVELCTCDLSTITGLSISAISHHLRILKDRHIVTYRKDGKNVFYRLDDRHITDIVNKTLEHLGESETDKKFRPAVKK